VPAPPSAPARPRVPRVIVAFVGGIGVFLLGMVLLTEGLRALAGRSLRRGLARFTGNRWSAVLSGAVATALVQSSTATTMTTIGLVAAGLLPLVNAIGVILGANLGTTTLAWIVAYFGLKLDISAIALVAVALGALLRLLGRGKLAAIGLPVAGFGLLFVGISFMQGAMAGLADQVDLGAFSTASFGGLLLLVAIGAVMTIVMQASGAAVAATLTALAAGAIGLEQAAALVIGQNIGTTPKALLASLGATAPARRTAVAHVLFNVGTGVVALVIMPAFIWLVTADGRSLDPAITLAAFHSMFNVVGVALVLPWLGTFSRFVSWLVPDRGPILTRYLSPAVAAEPPVAVKAARTTLLMCATEIGDEAMVLATKATAAREAQAARLRLQRVQGALDEAASFLAAVRSDATPESAHRRHVSVLHALDHLQGAVAMLAGSQALDQVGREPELRELREVLGSALEAMVGWTPVLAPDGPAEHVLEAFARIAPLQRRTRRRVLRLVALGEADPDRAEVVLEALAWAHAFGHHLMRAVHHLREPAPGDEA
jgi:phosphate:Na+ symporter